MSFIFLTLQIQASSQRLKVGKSSLSGNGSIQKTFLVGVNTGGSKLP